MRQTPVELTVDGQKIRGNLYVPKNPGKRIGVLFLHGWTGRPNQAAAEVLASHGYTALTISLRGHNDSDGDIHEVSRKNSLDDAIAAYDFLATHLPPESQIIVAGSSYGSYTAVMLSAERPVSALSLRVPASYPDEGFDEPQWGRGNEDPVIAKWRETAVAFKDNTAFRHLHEFAGSIQIIEAEEDEQVPAQTVKNYVDTVADTKRLDYHLMRGWPHSLGDNLVNHKQYQAILLAWLAKL